MSGLLPKTYGALLIGYALSSVLYGVTCIQLCHYFKRFWKSDKWLVKVLVIAVWSITTLNQALVCDALYYYMIDHRGNMGVLVPKASLIASGLNPVAATLIHVFFTYRVFIMSGHNWLIAVVIISTSLSQSILGLFYMFESLLNNGSERYSFLITPSFALTAAADILITIALTYYLQIRKSGHEATNSVINKIIVSTISNGLLTALVAVITLIIFVTVPDSMIPYCGCWISGKAYMNTLLTSLNARKGTRHRLSQIRRRSSAQPASGSGQRSTRLRQSVTAVDIELNNIGLSHKGSSSRLDSSSILPLSPAPSLASPGRPLPFPGPYAPSAWPQRLKFPRPPTSEFVGRAI